MLFPKCIFLYPRFPQVVPKSADVKILTQFYMQIWVQFGRDVTRLYDGAFPANLFQCELRKSSLLFCSDLTGANQNVGHCLSMWDMRQGMEMLCSPTKKVEQMFSEYFQEKINSLSYL